MSHESPYTRRYFGTLTGCAAPSFDILGSFFPAWLVCLALGLLLTVGGRWLLLRLRVVSRFRF